MFDNLLTSFGIGSIVVDTKIENNINFENDLIRGVIILKGGKKDQHINKIELTLVEKIENTDKTSQFEVVENELETYTYSQDFIVKEAKEERISFQFALESLEFDSNKNDLYLKTHVFIENSVDAYDEDCVYIKNK
ncbi:sporulation protein [Mammaliicoccus stepanovicii]|uniref:Stage 0 sporulation protein M n=1 Tax=Mammaliicoccus stepanovicii TaxID=643214 RepID=A0A239ZEK2_9STAP|nr:sporulation protein [Mammaliicoccus stepanovicii]PNZ71776.1 hypothetical protein CD111_12130 [Mammaliicoccus stepanovicii]GGI41944.1 hypothetical protein GCM10010896_15950 [Mammaliicoccus stepanovicii]SNV69651.1 Stage 0 sporulation protein M [Mammaliicoccus stepanovicii]